MTDPLDAIGLAEGAVRHLLDTAAAVEAVASAELLQSTTRAEFLERLDIAAIALKNGEVAKRALVALAECRKLIAGPPRGIRAKVNRRRIQRRVDRAMSEISAAIPVAAPLQ